MSKTRPPATIRLRGVRQNNLKGFDLDLPAGRLTVVTGLSGSGKSSLAFETLFAEGQRRYIETFSPYARQFFDRMDKPAVDRIEGIPPAIALEQRNSVRTTRSTVGTMTEICDHMKVLWPHLAQLHCRQCGKPVTKDTPAQIWERLPRDATVLITFDLPLSAKLGWKESLALLAGQGFQRVLIDGAVQRLDELPANAVAGHALTVVQDRITTNAQGRARFVEACEQAYHFGKGRLTVHTWNEIKPGVSAITGSAKFSNRRHCAECDLEYRDATPALFSFNHPVGACPNCKGFGRIITIDYERAIPDRTKSLADGAVKPWQTGVSADCQKDLLKACRKERVPTDVPFHQLSPAHQQWVIDGDAGYGSDKEHQWPKAWYGVKGYFRWLESKAYKMHVRVLLSRYRAYSRCPECHGKRFNADSLLHRLPSRDGKAGLTLAEFYALPAADALATIEQLAAAHARRKNDPVALALHEVRTRLAYLVEVGLGYLTLDRPTRTLSGGETERVNLTTCLGTRLVNTLFVLDEPSVGLHPRDTERLIRILHRLRDAGNTVVVVEHESSVMRAADDVIDLGPGHGDAGGQLMFHGPFNRLLKTQPSLTADYLSGRRQVEIPARRPVTPDALKLRLEHATLHNLNDLTVEIPLGRFVCLTGVSGSGKTTLAREILYPLLANRLSAAATEAVSEEPAATNPEADDEDSAAHEALRMARLSGTEALGRVLMVDQSGLGRTPRSNPAVYVGAFDHLRELFAASPLAKQRALNASAFSFNSGQGQCERCRGAGFEKIEMQFLSDVFIRCPECHGRRYREHILEVKLATPDGASAMSIGDLLQATVDDAQTFLAALSASRHRDRAQERLRMLQEVGLGYLRLGQPINTLSGGESQRLKLAAHMAEFQAAGANLGKPSLFIFDEPTTGLHFEDVRILLQAFQKLVAAGHSLLVLEHNLDVIKCADWVIDLGPDAGASGGRLVATGTPETIAANGQSFTGQFLRTVLPKP